ncbi:protein vms-1-like [Thrips palmi]|uniref:Protein vms-1-like n=1 Tax=Thrips palmi TaxID=161013 RepID=A0A6P8Z5A4_THRPL|nr:protein vms-1-like [Thrips palmi]
MEKSGCSLHDTAEFLSVTAELELAQCMLKGRIPEYDPHVISLEVSRQLEDLVVADAHSCSCCSVKFPNATAQRAHFKLDWHRYNIKRQLAGLSPVREEAFTVIADKGDDIESISGSESESEEEGEKGDIVDSNHRAKVFFRNKHGQVISLYRCLLFPAKECTETTPVSEFVTRALCLAVPNQWAIFMLGGGHFAAGIFQGQEPLVHKTFHCYTVRAKQGGSQSTRDNKGGNHPKSAGASLRRYNEQALIQHVQDLISAWADHLKSCTLIFVRAVGPGNRSVLYGGKSPPLDKTDSRIRTIPFPTRRATFSEVKRVLGMLSFVEDHGPESEFLLSDPASLNDARKLVTEKNCQEGAKPTQTENEGSPRRSKNKGGVKPNRAKSRPSPQRSLPASVSYASSESEAPCTSDIEIIYQDQEIKFSDTIKDVDQQIKNEVSKKKKKDKSKDQKTSTDPIVPQIKKSKEEILKEEKLRAQEAERKQRLLEKRERKQAAIELRKQEQEAAEAANPVLVFQKELVSALESNDVQRLKNCLSSDFLQTLPSPLPGGLQETLNLPFTQGNTALHLASKTGTPLLVSELMTVGADPTALNKKQQTPYSVAVNADTRKAFQDFLVNNPDKFDYSKSKIPVPLSEEEEKAQAKLKAELKAAKNKAKKEHEKVQRKKKAEEKAEQEERARFMAMTDREKRALAAERRILAAQKKGTTDDSKTKPIVLARCFLCAIDISGQVSFDYDQYRFCTIECLRAHRKQTNPDGKINRL